VLLLPYAIELSSRMFTESINPGQWCRSCRIPWSSALSDSQVAEQVSEATNVGAVPSKSQSRRKSSCVGISLRIPTECSVWYFLGMAHNVSHTVALGDRGRFVIPSEVRDRHGWHTGASLIAVDTDAGLIVMSTDEALAWLQSRLKGRDLVAELLAERRAEVESESA